MFHISLLCCVVSVSLYVKLDAFAFVFVFDIGVLLCWLCCVENEKIKLIYVTIDDRHFITTHHTETSRP